MIIKNGGKKARKKNNKANDVNDKRKKMFLNEFPMKFNQ